MHDALHHGDIALTSTPTPDSCARAIGGKVALGLLDGHVRHCVIDGHGEGTPVEMTDEGGAGWRFPFTTAATKTDNGVATFSVEIGDPSYAFITIKPEEHPQYRLEPSTVTFRGPITGFRAPMGPTPRLPAYGPYCNYEEQVPGPG